MQHGFVVDAGLGQAAGGGRVGGLALHALVGGPHPAHQGNHESGRSTDKRYFVILFQVCAALLARGKQFPGGLHTGLQQSAITQEGFDLAVLGEPRGKAH
jgi:hypothetical protein